MTVTKYNIPEHNLLKEFCVLEATPERLCTITTLFDPNQFGHFGGGFLYKSGGTSTLFTDMNDIERQIPQRMRNERPVKERFDVLKQSSNTLYDALL